MQTPCHKSAIRKCLVSARHQVEILRKDQHLNNATQDASHLDRARALAWAVGLRSRSPRFLVHGAQVCSGLHSPPLPAALRSSRRLISEKPPFLPEVKARMHRACQELLHQRTECPQGSRSCPSPRSALVRCTRGAEWRTVVTCAQLCQPSSAARPGSSEPTRPGTAFLVCLSSGQPPPPPCFPLVAVV